MGVLSGTYGLVEIDGAIVAQVKDWSMSRTQDIQEYTVLGTAGFKNKRPTFKNVNVTGSVYWDPGDTTGQVALETAWENAQTVNLKIYPSADVGGTPVAGDVYYEGLEAYVSDMSISGDSENLVEGTINFAVNGNMIRKVT